MARAGGWPLFTVTRKARFFFEQGPRRTLDAGMLYMYIDTAGFTDSELGVYEILAFWFWEEVANTAVYKGKKHNQAAPMADG